MFRKKRKKEPKMVKFTVKKNGILGSITPDILWHVVINKLGNEYIDIIDGPRCYQVSSDHSKITDGYLGFAMYIDKLPTAKVLIPEKFFRVRMNDI